MRNPRGTSKSVWIALVLSLLGVGALSVLSTVPTVHAATSLSTWCAAQNPGTTSYSAGTCTVIGLTYVTSDVTVSNGEELFVSGCGLIQIQGANLTVDSGGTLLVENCAGEYLYSYGMIILHSTVDGAIINYGNITVDNAEPSNGILNIGVVTNECSGSIDIETGTYGYIDDGYFGTGHGVTYNYGTITGTVTSVNGGVLDNLSGSCLSTSVPQFPLGPALVFALSVPALLVLRKKAVSFRGLS